MKIARAALLLLLTATPLHAAEPEPVTGAWTFGANFGVSFLSLAGDVNYTGFNVPMGAGLNGATLQPGMRVGYALASGSSEIYADLGINYASFGDGDTSYSYLMTGNYQFNFAPANPTSLYGTLGAGIHVAGFLGESESDPLVGLGFGVRKKVAAGNGVVRGELRYDRLMAPDDEGIDSFALKVGMDLWIR